MTIKKVTLLAITILAVIAGCLWIFSFVFVHCCAPAPSPHGDAAALSEAAFNPELRNYGGFQSAELRNYGNYSELRELR
jgi:hypothetical protein